MAIDLSQYNNTQLLALKPGNPAYDKLSVTDKKQISNKISQINQTNANAAPKAPKVSATQQSPNIAKADSKPNPLTAGIKSEFGYNNELDFLVAALPGLWNNDNQDTIYNNLSEGTTIVNGVSQGNSALTYTTVFKNKNSTNTAKLKDYYNNNVFKGNSDNRSPYMKLVYDFSKKGYEPLTLKAADFAYLKDLGVYPINRLWTLRRFNQGVIVPNNLLDWNGTTTLPTPISTVVGWIKPEDEKFFSLDFNENWETTTSRVDQVLSDIMDKEFSLKLNAVPIPGFSQGLLFGFLRAMGLTDEYGLNNIPMGDPNVLQEGATRAVDNNAGFGLKSSISVTLKTSYEQKFIGDIDPGSAMLDIIRNLVYMGTSNVKYVLNGNSSIITNLLKAANSTGAGAVNAWWDFIVDLVKKFLGAITDIFKDVKDKFNTANKSDDNPAAPAKTAAPTKTGEKTGKAEDNKNKQDDIAKFEGPLSDKVKFFTDVAEGTLKTILASTVAKWKWALIGSVGVMTGINTTPWHLIIGNPYSPFFSVGNIVVEKVKVDWNNEFAYNDMPTKIDVDIQIRLGRNLGAQEILASFNNGYARTYAKTPTNSNTSQTNTTKTNTKKV